VVDTDDKYTERADHLRRHRGLELDVRPGARQYFWHRFFSHQPDLNFENPAVHEAMFDVVRFWMDMGIDGFRLDAVPYLFEEEGHNGENHPRDPRVPREAARAMVDASTPGRMLLAEANQWPADVVDYFGTDGGAECQMCFHFPVMPRMFYYALREETAPRSSSPGATPRRSRGRPVGHLPAQPRRAHPGDGHRRGARRRCTAGTPRTRGCAPTSASAAASLRCWTTTAPRSSSSTPCCCRCPGSPCLYYGDEIGMGDNIWLPDRDAVRTPMQWTPDRNAGFSTADPGKLYLPVEASDGPGVRDGPFPEITDQPYVLTLSPYSFLWFRLVRAEKAEEPTPS
jgi:maltose alpha-D-glucosyltransferase/alpha-amylase